MVRNTILVAGEIRYRHVDVEKNDVRLQLDHFVDGFFAVLGIAANLKRMPIEKRANGCPRSEMVVYDKDSSWQVGSD
jgi:hypothetical protein